MTTIEQLHKPRWQRIGQGAKRKLLALAALRRRAYADAPLGRNAQCSFAPLPDSEPPVFRASTQSRPQKGEGAFKRSLGHG